MEFNLENILMIIASTGIFGLGLFFIYKQNLEIFKWRKSVKTAKQEKEINFYCEACQTDNRTYLKSVNLAAEPPLLLRKCIRCNFTLTEEPFDWKHKKMILTDEWELAGMHRLSEVEEQEQKINEKSSDFVNQKNEFPYKCNICDMKFKMPVELRWHKVKIHPPESDVKTEPDVKIEEDVIDEKSKVSDEKEIEAVWNTEMPDQTDKTIEEVENQDIPLYDDEVKENEK